MPQVPNSGSFNADNPKRGPGRPKGSVNKLTADIKSAVVEAFEKSGGVDYLVTVAKSKPEVFCGLLGRVLPMQIGGDKDNPVELVFRWKS